MKRMLVVFAKDPDGVIVYLKVTKKKPTAKNCWHSSKYFFAVGFFFVIFR